MALYCVGPTGEMMLMEYVEHDDSLSGDGTAEETALSVRHRSYFYTQESLSNETDGIVEVTTIQAPVLTANPNIYITPTEISMAKRGDYITDAACNWAQIINVSKIGDVFTLTCQTFRGTALRFSNISSIKNNIQQVANNGLVAYFGNKSTLTNEADRTRPTADVLYDLFNNILELDTILDKILYGDPVTKKEKHYALN